MGKALCLFLICVFIAFVEEKTGGIIQYIQNHFDFKYIQNLWDFKSICRCAFWFWIVWTMTNIRSSLNDLNDKVDNLENAINPGEKYYGQIEL